MDSSFLRAPRESALLAGLFVATLASGVSAADTVYTLQIDPSTSFLQVVETPMPLPGDPSPVAPVVTRFGIAGTFTITTREPDLFYFHNVTIAPLAITTDPLPSPPGPIDLSGSWRGLWQGTDIAFSGYPCAYWWGPGSCMVAQPMSSFPAAAGTFDGQDFRIEGTLGSDPLSPYTVTYRLEAATIAAVPEPQTVILFIGGVLAVGVRIASRRRERTSA